MGRPGRSTARRLVAAWLIGLLVLGACGSEGGGSDQIRLQANAVGGGQLFVDDLASEDTVLWFWAPW